MATVVIIGAGLTGLSTAYHLEKHGFFDYEIYEKNNRPGGLLQSESNNGFTFDYTGHYLHVNHQEFHDFLSTTCDFANFDYITRSAAIYSNETLTDYPFQMNLHGLPTNVIYECLQGYITRATSTQKPSTFYDWVIKYFGKGFGNHFFFPYNSKLLAYSPKKIHPAWTGRFVPTTNLETILRGALEKNPPHNIGYNSGFYYPKTGGIEFLIQKLVQKISKKVVVNHQATHIDQQAKTIHFKNGKKTTYQTLVTTAPLTTTLSSLQKSSRSTLATAQKKLLCTTVINFNLGFSPQPHIPCHWIYFPEKKYDFYRIGFWNNISPSLTKKGHGALYGELSYQPSQKTFSSMQKALDRSINQTLQFLGITQQDIASNVTLILDHAYVIYDQWRQKNLPKILTELRMNNIWSIGRFGHWKYSSMQEAFFDGKEAANNVVLQLSKSTMSVLPAQKTTITTPQQKHAAVTPYRECTKE